MKTKPVAIFRHHPAEGAGYFATFLDAHRIPHTLIAIDAGSAIPTRTDDFSGLCFMGGPMSVNDDLPWLPPAFDLIRAAAARDIPVIGHCLGGQLLAKALGGSVGRNPVKELGWGRVDASGPLAAEWLGDMTAFEAFHWHGETFSLPPGATRLLGNAHCVNQAFVIGPHLGMQCHVEMTEAMIHAWSRFWKAENAAPGPSVQTPEEMCREAGARIAAMRDAADRLYGRWIAGLKA
ncbi:glutamine amidotransferase [Denitratisoma sp. DHT3]|uniref:type 1 glutamine amidotransferase n=1 Tax=Denitratisoma sp. DHT3 TaxID=1981880 RepID=UPI001198C26C|nr:type 1 glutamine amidotransferase [Denitratisoma sp. DHT3]QDX81135.1 glutamine amidotransferase [Denitratisoma sp. DHT3]